MAEIVGSAVATEAVSRISSFLSGEKLCRDSAEDKAERLEMAVLKIHSVVAVSEDMHSSHPPLLQWKAKLKRVAKEGDHLLRQAHKKQLVECNDHGASNGASSSGTSISQYLIQAARRYVPFRRNSDDELDDATLRRFERLADGAGSFFRLVESGGRPKAPPVLRPSLTRSLLAGEAMEFSFRAGSTRELVLLWPWLDRPQSEDELEACIVVSREDEVKWQRNIKMMVVLRLSEGSDLLSIAMACLELLPPQFGAARAAIRGLLIDTIGNNRSHSSKLSAESLWCCRHMQSRHRADCVPPPSSSADHHTGLRSLPPSVTRLTASFYASPPAIDGAGPPLLFMCTVSPYFFPDKYSSQYELVEDNGIRELLPKVEDGFLDHQRQALECSREVWCPTSSTYCAVAPVVSKPMSISQASSLKKNSGGPTGRRRTARRRPHTVLKSQNVARK
ncbi:hypothetical protein ACP4OV_004948 [Aristida adscensionis]